MFLLRTSVFLIVSADKLVPSAIFSVTNVTAAFISSTEEVIISTLALVSSIAAANSSVVAELSPDALFTSSDILYNCSESVTSLEDILFKLATIADSCFFILTTASAIVPISSLVFGIWMLDVKSNSDTSSITSVNFVIGFVIIVMTIKQITTDNTRMIPPTSVQIKLMELIGFNTSEASA